MSMRFGDSLRPAIMRMRAALAALGRCDFPFGCANRRLTMTPLCTRRRWDGWIRDQTSGTSGQTARSIRCSSRERTRRR